MKTNCPSIRSSAYALFLLLVVCLNGFQLSAQTIRYQNTIRGGFTYATNTLRTSGGLCNTAGGTMMSSSSDIVLPAGSKIVKAFLYVENYGTAINSFKFRVPGGNYVLMNNASPGYIASPVSSRYGQMIIDVSSMVPMFGYTTNYIAGGDPTNVGRYSVADVAPYDASNNGYGWCLYVIYTNANSKFRNVTIADACQVMDYASLTNRTVTFDIPNVLVPSTGTVNAVVAITGCWGEQGTTLLDNLTLGPAGGSQTQLQDPSTGSTDDVYNGTIGTNLKNNVTVDGGPSMNGPYTAKNPFNPGTAGGQNSAFYDSDIFDATGALSPSTNPVTVRVTANATAGDIFTAGAFAVSVDIQSALVTKSLNPTAIPSGGIATYTFTVSNTTPGGRNQTNIGFTDTIPASLVIANPNNVVITGGTGGTVTATPGSNIFKLSGLNLNFGQSATITLNVTNKPGKFNPDCSGNPSAFTNSFTNLGGLTSNLSNGVEPQCLIVYAPPKAGFKADTACAGTATTFTDTSVAVGSTITNWKWDFGDGSVSTQQSPTHIYTNSGTYQVKLKITDNYNLSDSVTKTVLVKAQPIVTVSPAVSICQGDKTQLNATGGGTYLWDNAATLTASNIPNPIASPNNTTTYKVTVSHPTTLCKKDTIVVVTVRPLPSIQINGNPSVCPGGNPTILTASNTNVVSGTPSYLWTPGNLTTATVSLSPTVQTDYTVKLTDGSGCSNTKVVTVLMSPPPSGMAPNIVNRSCLAADGSITVTSVTGGSSPYQYSKNGGSFQNGNAFNNLDSAIYSITVKDAKGCTYAMDVPISITPAASSATISTAASGCGAPSGSISISGVVGGIPPYQYSLDNVTYKTSSTFSPLGSGSYQVFIKDANGCIYNPNTTVGSLSGPSNMTATITADSCARNNGSIRITNVTGGTAPIQYSIDNVTFNTNTVFNNLPGVTTTIYVKDAANCTFSKAFNVPYLPPVTNFGMAIVADSCALTTGEISVNNETGGVSPYKYQLDANTPQSSYVFKNLVANSYQVTLIDKNGCSLSQPATVAALAPILTVTPVVTDATCSQSNGAVSLSSTGGTAPISWQLNTDPAIAGNTFTGLAIATHTVTAIDANNCKLAQQIQVNDIAGPNTITATQTTTSCTAPTGTYTVTQVFGGTAPFTYSLDGVNFVSSATFNNLANQAYTVTIKDANGCTMTENFTIQVAASPTLIQISIGNETCSNKNGALTITGVVGGTAPYLYSVDNSPFTATTSYTGLDNGIHTVVVDDANHCKRQETPAIQDEKSPNGLDFETKPTYCEKKVGEIKFNGAFGGKAPYKYSVNNSPFSTNTVYGGLDWGNNYIIAVEDANGCTYSATAIIDTVARPYNYTVTHSDDTCSRNSGSIRILTMDGPATPFSYSIDGTTFQASKVFTGVAPGTYTVIGQDANGCQASKQETVGVVNGPDTAKVVNITPPHCTKSDGQVQVMVNSITGGTKPYSITLNSVTNPANGIFTGLKENVYTLTISDKYKCLNTQKVILVDIPGPQSANYTIVANRCSENNGSITFNSVNSGTSPYEFSDDDVTYTTKNKFENLAAGPATFYVRDNAGCVLPVNETIPDAPGSTDITADVINENCFRGDGSINNIQGVGGTAPLSFIVHNSYMVNPGESVTDLSKGSYKIVVSDANGCKYDKTFEILNIPGPIAHFEPEVDSGIVPLDIRMLNYSPDSCTYEWTFGDGNTAIGYDALNYYTDSGTFNIALTVTNKAGCFNSTERTVILRPSINIFVPNSFTPNGDGVNDYFTASGENLKSFTLSVYNRWGELLATVDENSPGWNGTYKDGLCKQDVYVYKLVAIDYLNLKHEHKGRIQLIK